jgi:hypothetical protein
MTPETPPAAVVLGKSLAAGGGNLSGTTWANQQKIQSVGASVGGAVCLHLTGVGVAG